MAKRLQIDILPPQTGDGDCDIETDPQLSSITMVALAKFGELEGMTNREKVETLTIHHGWSQVEIARALKISPQAVSKHWEIISEGLDIAPLPLRQRAMLRRKIEGLYSRAVRMEDDGKGLVIALRAVEILAKLDGLNNEAQPEKSVNEVYSTPAEVAEVVKMKVLELHGRRELAGVGS